MLQALLQKRKPRREIPVQVPRMQTDGMSHLRRSILRPTHKKGPGPRLSRTVTMRVWKNHAEASIGSGKR